MHFTLHRHSYETKKFWQSNFRHKLAWTTKQHEPCESDQHRRDWRPALASGTHKDGAKSVARRASSAHRRQPSLAISRSPMDATTPLHLQLLFEGKTGRVFAESRRYFRPGQRGSFLCVIQTHCEPPEIICKPSLFIGVHQPHREPLADGVLSGRLHGVPGLVAKPCRGAQGLDLRA